MDAKDLGFNINFVDMEASLLYKGREVRTFNLNKGEVGTLQDSFKCKHKDGKKIKHDIIIELAPSTKGIKSKPVLHIYPIAGEYVISSKPIYANEVIGNYNDYLNNHKFHGR